MWNCLQTAATQKNWMIWPVQTGYRPLACRKQRVQTDTVQRDDYIYPVAQPHACNCLTRSCDSCVYICTVYIYIYHIHVWLPRLLLDMLDCFWKLLATQPLQPASSTQSPAVGSQKPVECPRRTSRPTWPSCWASTPELDWRHPIPRVWQR